VALYGAEAGPLALYGANESKGATNQDAAPFQGSLAPYEGEPKAQASPNDAALMNAGIVLTERPLGEPHLDEEDDDAGLI
jgi:hypothetical protein